MALRRTTLVLLIVLGVALAGAVAGYFMFPDKVQDFIGGSTANTNTTNTSLSNTNTSTTPTNLSTPQDLNGDTPLTGTIKVGTTELKFTSLDRLTSFDQIAAPDGQQYVVLYFEGIPASATSMVFDTLTTAQLVDGTKRYSPNTLKVASNVVKNDRGYIVFVAPASAGKLTMEVGSGTEVQTVVLP